MKLALGGLMFVATIFGVQPAWAQATARSCGATEAIGPACLLVRQEISKLPSGPLFWHLDRYASDADARRAAKPTSAVVEAFGSIWLFTIERRGWRAKRGSYVAEVGPLPLKRGSTFAAEYLRSVFSPGMSAPLHVHSGPEAFFAVGGDTCLETPEGMQLGRGPGNSLVIRAGPPMLLMAVGREPRRGFALILHNAAKPPTTLTQQWQPQGLCARQLSSDQAR